MNNHCFVSHDSFIHFQGHYLCFLRFIYLRLTAGGPGVLQKAKILQFVLHVTVPACEVLASISEPKSGRSGVSECERSKARAHTGFKGRSACRLLGAGSIWFYETSPEPRMARAIINYATYTKNSFFISTIIFSRME